MIDQQLTARRGVLSLGLGCLGAVLLVTCPVARASDPVEPGLAERILEEDRDRVARVVGVLGARLSHPQRISGGLGAIVSSQPAGYECRTVCEFRGFLVQAEPGISGGQLSAGYAVVNGAMGPDAHFISHVYVGYGIKGTLLRTWGSSSLSPDEQTLLGVEGELTFIGVNFSLGLFHEVGSADPDDPWVVTGGVGWGF